MAPANAKAAHVVVEKKLKELEKFSNETELNYIEWNDKNRCYFGRVVYQYARSIRKRMHHI